MKPDLFTWLWVAWVLAFLVVEAAALLKGHGTLSGHVWFVMDHYLIARTIVVALLFWLSWHWFAETVVAQRWTSTYRDDGVVAAIGVVIGVLTRRSKRS